MASSAIEAATLYVEAWSFRSAYRLNASSMSPKNTCFPFTKRSALLQTVRHNSAE